MLYSRKWRTLVTWDAEKKVYLYRNHEIFPLSFNEQREMPLYAQHNYYSDEIKRIDDLIAQRMSGSQMTEPAEESISYFFEMIEE